MSKKPTQNQTDFLKQIRRLKMHIKKLEDEGFIFTKKPYTEYAKPSKQNIAKLKEITPSILRSRADNFEEKTGIKKSTIDFKQSHSRIKSVQKNEISSARQKAEPKERTLLSPEERAKIRSEAARKAGKTRWANYTEEQRKQVIARMQEGLRKYRANLPPKPPKPILTEEQKKQIRSEAAKKAAITRKANYEKLTPEQKKELFKKRSEAAKKRWQEYTAEQQEKRLEGLRKYQAEKRKKELEEAKERVDRLGLMTKEKVESRAEERERIVEKILDNKEEYKIPEGFTVIEEDEDLPFATEENKIYEGILEPLEDGYNHNVASYIIALIKEHGNVENIKKLHNTEEGRYLVDLAYGIAYSSDQEKVFQSAVPLLERLDIPFDYTELQEMAYETQYD